MKFLTKLILGIIVTLLILPATALAVDEWTDNDVCPWGDKFALDSLPENKWYSDIQEEITSGAASTCGTPNDFTKSLEKGDCTEEVITEVSEVVGRATETADARIIDVYSGLCCLVMTERDGKLECDDAVTIYKTNYDDCAADALNCEHRQWIISPTGAGIIKVYVKQMYNWGAGTVGLIAVVTLVISGIQISVSNVSGDITSAKERIFKALSAIVLLFLSGLILYTINPTFFS